MINEFITSKYKDGGRGEDNQYDCWGLARAVRHALYNRPMLPSIGGERLNDPVAFTNAYEKQIKDMREVEEEDIRPGTVIAVIAKRRICIHVALVIHDLNNTGLGLHVIDTNPNVNVRIQALYEFKNKHSNRIIKYYDDQDIS